MAAILLKKVSRVYPGSFWAVDEVSLEIEDQEFVVFVGPRIRREQAPWISGKPAGKRATATVDKVNGNME
jgi:hypothetical protein